MSDTQLGFVFHKEKCIQCLGCEIACKTWRQTERGIAWRHVLNVWNGTYPNVTCASLSISCLHCVEPACSGACPTGAISKRENDGAVLVDKALCTGCRICLDACPYDVPRFGTDGLMQKCDMCQSLYSAPDSAIETPPCVRTCPTGALELTVVTSCKKIEAEKEILYLFQQT